MNVGMLGQLCPSCWAPVSAHWPHSCGTGYRPRPGDIDFRLSDEDVDRIARRVVEMLSPKKRLTEQ